MKYIVIGFISILLSCLPLGHSYVIDKSEMQEVSEEILMIDGTDTIESTITTYYCNIMMDDTDIALHFDMGGNMLDSIIDISSIHLRNIAYRLDEVKEFYLKDCKSSDQDHDMVLSHLKVATIRVAGDCNTDFKTFVYIIQFSEEYKGCSKPVQMSTNGEISSGECNF